MQLLTGMLGSGLGGRKATGASQGFYAYSEGRRVAVNAAVSSGSWFCLPNNVCCRSGSVPGRDITAGPLMLTDVHGCQRRTQVKGVSLTARSRLAATRSQASGNLSTPRLPKLTDAELLETLLLALAREACKVVAEEVASMEAVDVVLTLALGFPPQHGGVFVFLDRLAGSSEPTSPFPKLQAFARAQQAIVGVSRGPDASGPKAFRPDVPPSRLPVGGNHAKYAIPKGASGAGMVAIGAAAAAYLAFWLKSRLG